MAPKKRGCRKKKKNPLADKLARLENENRQLKEKLRKAETIIDIQKKISDILTIDQNLTSNGRNS
jgi:cell shape-determining protein MreC